MKQTERVDQIATLCKEIESRIMDIYCQREALKENKIVFNMGSELPIELLKELLNEKWWMKWYDRTFYIVSVCDNAYNKYIDIAAIKDTYPKEETEKFLDEVYKIMKTDKGNEKTVEVRAKDGSYQSIIKEKEGE